MLQRIIYNLIFVLVFSSLAYGQESHPNGASFTSDVYINNWGNHFGVEFSDGKKIYRTSNDPGMYFGPKDWQDSDGRTSPNYFTGKKPSFQFTTGQSDAGYEEFFRIQHQQNNDQSHLRRLGLLLQIGNDDSKASAKKMAGLMLESEKTWAQDPDLHILTRDKKRMTVTHEGAVGIGTEFPNGNSENYKLAVNGKIGAKKVVVENTSSTWGDYVFKEGYDLQSLKEVEDYIKEHHHLPGIPSAGHIAKKGISLGELTNKQMKKIEEMTLHMIDMKKELKELKKKNKKLAEQNKKLREKNERLDKLEEEVAELKEMVD